MFDIEKFKARKKAARNELKTCETHIETLDRLFHQYRKAVQEDLNLEDANSILNLGNLLAKQMEYSDYLKTFHWMYRRSIALNKYPKCILCGVKDSREIHHNNYKNLFREKLIDDIAPICRGCHQELHQGDIKDRMRSANNIVITFPKSID